MHRYLECKIVQLLWKIVWQFLLKLNMYLKHNLSVLLLRYLPECNENLCSYKHLSKCLQWFIHNGPKLETTQKPIKWGIDKQTVVYPDTGLLLIN